MSIQNAIRFIHKVQGDDEFRNNLFRLKNISQFEGFLEEKELDYTEFEFDEAYHHLLVQCQFEEQADRLQNVINLMRLLF